MASKGASDKIFIEGAIRTVARIGIENTRTKEVAEYAGFSEATMYRRFPTKEILLREAFLYADKQVSAILMRSPYLKDHRNIPFEQVVYTVWHDVFRYLISHRDETLFLIRYRYSSLYTNEVRSQRQAYNGGFDAAYAEFEKNLGSSERFYRGFFISYVFEMTLCFAEKIVTGRLEDTKETEYGIWVAVSSAVKSWGLQQREQISDEQGIKEAQQA